MRFLKTLAVFIVLFALTVCAAAEGTTQSVTYEPFGSDLHVTLPEGLVYTMTQEAGQVYIQIDSAKTDWDMMATQTDRWGEIVVDFQADFPAGATWVSGTTGYNKDWNGDWSYNAMKSEYDMCYDFLTNVASPSKQYGGGQLGIAQYSVSQGMIVPEEFDGDQIAYVMCVFFDSNDKNTRNVIAAKYASIRISYSDEKARAAERALTPVSRIEAANVEGAKPADGSVFYMLTSEVQMLDTMITPPAEALSFRAIGYRNLRDDENPIAGPVSDELLRTVRMEGIEGPDDFDYFSPVFYWYDGPFDEATGKPTGKLIGVECMSIYMMLGDPKPWPNYLDPSWQDGSKLDASRLNFTVSKDGGATSASFADVAYDAGIGTATVSGKKGVSPREDLTQYNLIVEVEAPAGAKYYKSSSLFDSVLLGNYYTGSGYMGHNSLLDLGELVSVPASGKVVYEESLLRAATYVNDPGLTVYYDANPTSFFTGSVSFVDWYDADGEMIGREWLVVQYETMADVGAKDIETSVPSSPSAPVLITKDLDSSYQLQAAIYPQTSANGTQMHYELKLLRNGAEVSLGELDGTFELLLPFPDGVNPDEVAFSVNHYNSAGERLDSFTTNGETGVKLEQVDVGVLMNVKSLSPFVLSWNHQHNLVYTASGNTFTETCSSPSCDHKATWTLEVGSTVVSGSTVENKSIKSANWLGGDLAFFITDAKGNSYQKMPTEPGTYTLKVSVGNAELVFTFTVIAQPSLPATGDDSLPLWLLMAVAMLSMACGLALYRKARRA